MIKQSVPVGAPTNSSETRLSRTESWRHERNRTSLRIEPKEGEAYLFPYQHLTAVWHSRAENGEVLKLSFSTHDIVIHGSDLNDLVDALQDQAVGSIACVAFEGRVVCGSAVSVTRIEILEVA